MAYTTPKTDWTEAYTPSPSDFNRIEGNTQANREDLSAEIDAVEADILLEESARIAADGVLQSNIDAVEAQLVKIKTITKAGALSTGDNTVDVTGFGFTPTACWDVSVFSTSTSEKKPSFEVVSFISDGVRVKIKLGFNATSITVTCAGTT